MELYLEIVFADVTKLRCSHARLEWTPIQYDLCRNKKKEEGRRRGEHHGKMEEETGETCLQANGPQDCHPP